MKQHVWKIPVSIQGWGRMYCHNKVLKDQCLCTVKVCLPLMMNLLCKPKPDGVTQATQPRIRQRKKETSRLYLLLSVQGSSSSSCYQALNCVCSPDSYRSPYLQSDSRDLKEVFRVQGNQCPTLMEWCLEESAENLLAKLFSLMTQPKGDHLQTRRALTWSQLVNTLIMDFSASRRANKESSVVFCYSD